jgi:hypothetical protein
MASAGTGFGGVFAFRRAARIANVSALSRIISQPMR